MERSKKNWLFPKFHKDAIKHGIPCHHRSYRDGGIIRNKREVLEAAEPVEREVALEDQAQNLKSPNTQQSLLLQLALQWSSHKLNQVRV